MFGQFRAFLRPFRPEVNNTHINMKISNYGETYTPDRWTCGKEKPAFSQVRAYEDGVWIENKIFIDQHDGESFEVDVPAEFSNNSTKSKKRTGETTIMPSERYEKWEVWATRETQCFVVHPLLLHSHWSRLKAKREIWER